MASARVAAAESFCQTLAHPAAQTTIAILVAVAQIHQPFAQPATQATIAALATLAPIRQPFAQSIPQHVQQWVALILSAPNAVLQQVA